MEPKHTEGILKVVTQKYEHNPKEVIIGLGIEQSENYHEILFNTILPDSDKEYIEQHEQIKADAERVVKCWNMYDELLNFAKEMVSRYPNSPWIYEEANELIKKATE